jgi:hypothetical protein
MPTRNRGGWKTCSPLHRLIALACLGLAVVVGSCSTVAPALPSTVYFSLDAPLCGLSMPMQFLIDSVPVGTDTFHVNAGPPPNRTLSRPFATTAARHTLSARATIGSIHPIQHVWLDTVVTLGPHDTATMVLPLYCS